MIEARKHMKIHQQRVHVVSANRDIVPCLLIKAHRGSCIEKKLTYTIVPVIIFQT